VLIAFAPESRSRAFAQIATRKLRAKQTLLGKCAFRFANQLFNSFILAQEAKNDAIL
jgi:hypothetical protein